jgi:hypothetical protein
LKRRPRLDLLSRCEAVLVGQPSQDNFAQLAPNVRLRYCRDDGGLVRERDVYAARALPRQKPEVEGPARYGVMA